MSLLRIARTQEAAARRRAERIALAAPLLVAVAGLAVIAVVGAAS